jgi:hypothetical protein
VGLVVGVYEFSVRRSAKLSGTVMSQIKRWAFVPLLTLACVLVACHEVNRNSATLLGVTIGLAVALPLALLVDRRRQRLRGYR